MRPEVLVNVLEAAMLAAGRALTLEDFLALFTGHADAPDRAALREALAQLGEDLAGRGIELVEVASGYRLQVREEYSPWLAGLFSERPPRYSRALLETLALIAYRQPITRGEIEDVRGVVVSSNIIKTLMEREWIRVLGHREVPGRPSLYGTTREFLDHFGLKSLEGLPPLADIRDLDQVEPDLFAPAPAPAEHVNSDGADSVEAHSDSVDGGAPAQAPSMPVDGESSPTASQADAGHDDGAHSDAVDGDAQSMLIDGESRPAAPQAAAADVAHNDGTADGVLVEDAHSVLLGGESGVDSADDGGDHDVERDALAQAPSVRVASDESLAALSEPIGDENGDDENDIVLDSAIGNAATVGTDISSAAGSDSASVVAVADEHHARVQGADDVAVGPASSERSSVVEQSTAQLMEADVDDETNDGSRGEFHGST